MRLLSLRLIVSLIVGVTLVSLFSSYYQILSDKQRQRRDLEHSAAVIAESVAGNVERSLEKGSSRELQLIVQRFGNREHLVGVAIYDDSGKLVAATANLKALFTQPPEIVTRAISSNKEQSLFVHLSSGPVHLYAVPLHHEGAVSGGLAIVHDASYIRSGSLRSWRETFFRVLAQVVIIVLITLLIVRWSMTGPIARAAQWMRALRTGKISHNHAFPDLDIFRPLAREVATMAESLNQARLAAENEARLRDAGESQWTAERLSVHVRSRLASGHLFVVSNREPYSHQRRGKTVEVVQPPSGLVTALEPVLNACDGTWIAHGSGDADSEVVDSNDRLRVPPDDPRYTLRRVWLTKEQEEGYYYGFANEGLWPLCHIAHTRPLFRAADWEHYRVVNRLFADAVLEEIKNTVKPVILVQDYHFALLPSLIKQARPDARVAIFWHIPWPNPEAFGICPWQRELLDGLLGADLLGFHIQSHCNNFLQTVDRFLESRVDWEHFSIRRRDHMSVVRPFPISVDMQEEAAPAGAESSSYLERSALLKNLGVEAMFLGIGVDRVDYTKGILERFQAIDRFFERHPSYRGEFTFVQIGAPSRTHIPRYHDLLNEVDSAAEQINWRYQTGKWKPIVFLKRQHSHEEIVPYYRAADLCLVTSLHDGMNLVAKEFVSQRSDERGVLILSRFTGAARELRDSLLVNPYDIDQTAEAIRVALEMNSEEKQARMQRMRRTLRENNIYRWAGNLITELCEVRLDAAGDHQEEHRARATAS